MLLKDFEKDEQTEDTEVKGAAGGAEIERRDSFILILFNLIFMLTKRDNKKIVKRVMEY